MQKTYQTTKFWKKNWNASAILKVGSALNWKDCGVYLETSQSKLVWVLNLSPAPFIPSDKPQPQPGNLE